MSNRAPGAAMIGRDAFVPVETRIESAFALEDGLVPLRTLPLCEAPVEFHPRSWALRYSYSGKRPREPFDGAPDLEGMTIRQEKYAKANVTFRRGEFPAEAVSQLLVGRVFDHVPAAFLGIVGHLPSYCGGEDPARRTADWSLLAGAMAARLGEARRAFLSGEDPLRDRRREGGEAMRPARRLPAFVALAPAAPDRIAAPAIRSDDPRLGGLFAGSARVEGSAADPSVALPVGAVIVLSPDGPAWIRGVGDRCRLDGRVVCERGVPRADVPAIPRDVLDAAEASLADEIAGTAYPPVPFVAFHGGRRWHRPPSTAALVDEDGDEREERLLRMASALVVPVLAAGDPDGLGEASTPWSAQGKDMWEYLSPGRSGQSVRAFFAGAMGDPTAGAAPPGATSYVVAPGSWSREWARTAAHDQRWLGEALPGSPLLATDVVLEALDLARDGAPAFRESLEGLSDALPAEAWRAVDAGLAAVAEADPDDVHYVAAWREGVELAKIREAVRRRGRMAGVRLARIAASGAAEVADWTPFLWAEPLSPAPEPSVGAPRHDYLADPEDPAAAVRR